MLNLHRVILPVCLFVLPAVPAFAQSESELKDFFEGKSVHVKLDMPASQEGIDVFPDARRPIDMNQYSSRIKSYGIAVHNGESVMITRVRVKDKLIEFQLGGGGYGTFGDDTNGSVSVPSAPKTQREKDLEKEVKSETDPARKKRLQRELDDMKSAREREDARNQSRAAAASEAKKERIAVDRLHGGSRFNIRYQEGVPPGLDAGGVMRALDQYVEFPFAAGPSSRPAARNDGPPPTPAADLRKGMLREDVDAALGKPDKTSEAVEGKLHVTLAMYTRGGQMVTTQFVEGVLIKYSISSR